MGAPRFSDIDFLSAFQKILPRGLAWPRDQDAIQTSFLAALSPSFKRHTDACADLLVDAFPATTYQLLSEWEQSLGLPDPCAGANQTIAQRVAQVVAKIALPGGQSAAYFIALANKLGYPGCTVKSYAPFRCGRSSMGDPLGDSAWMHVWTLNAPNLPVSYFRMGQNSMGDPLYSLGGKELQCTISRYAPAQSRILFAGVIS